MRKLNRLTDRSAKALRDSGMHADGGGLYLFIDSNGSKRWTFVFRWHGRRKEMGLGGFKSVGLADARDLAEDARKLVAKNINPIEHRKAQRVRGKTFGEFADELLISLEPSWKNDKHKAQWKMHLEVHAKKLRPIPIGEIITDDVLSVLRPVWTKTPESAARLRARIEKVLAAAKTQGLRDGDNPARWHGHLDNILPKRTDRGKKHHAAMPFEDVPALMEMLKAMDGISVRALRFTILTASRSQEVLEAKWGEFDLSAKVWTVPAIRMKAGKEHRVPLTAAMIEVLDEVRALDQPYVFPGGARNSHLSNMAMKEAMKHAGVGAFTPHGFRSSFRDWAGEKTNFPREVAEAALAHAVGNAVEQAYRRGDALAKRRKLMAAWDGFCTHVRPPSEKRPNPPSE